MGGTGFGDLSRGYATERVRAAFGKNWGRDGTRRRRHGTDGAQEVKEVLIIRYVHGVSYGKYGELGVGVKNAVAEEPKKEQTP